jgi:peptidoglycan/LPS O-acetylase OafA/YrhL
LRFVAALSVLVQHVVQFQLLLWVPALATTVLSLVFAALILNVGCNEHTLLRLRHSVLDYLGWISYGIYMFHPLCI